jgi:hypothetical protein
MGIANIQDDLLVHPVCGGHDFHQEVRTLLKVEFPFGRRLEKIVCWVTLIVTGTATSLYGR